MTSTHPWEKALGPMHTGVCSRSLEVLGPAHSAYMVYGLC